MANRYLSNGTIWDNSRSVKTCTKCGETKALEAFNLDKRHSTGRTAACRVCASAQRRTHYKVNRERMRKGAAERKRLWRERHPEEARRRSTETSKALRERDPDYFNRYYHANSDKLRPKARDIMRRDRKEHPERERERRRRYRRNNAEAVREREREKTYRRRAQMGPFSPDTAGYMTDLLTQPCAYCGATENITIDHIRPLERGGKHLPENLAPACLACNCSKGSQLLTEWSARSAR